MVKSKLINNKKGDKGYHSLAAIFTIIFSGLVIMVITSPAQEIPKEVDFGKIITEVDIATSKFYTLNSFIGSTKDMVENKKDGFSKTLGIGTEYVNRASSVNSCQLNGLQLWYDERISEDSDKLKDENENNESKIQENTETTSKSNICIPKFNENLKGKIESFYSESLEDSLTSGLIPIGMRLDDLNVVFDDKNLLNVDIKTSYITTTQLSKTTRDLSYDFHYDFGNYPSLLIVLNEVIGKIPDNLKIKVPQCLKIGDKSEEDCIISSIEKLIKEEDNGISLFEEYEFILTLIDKSKNSDITDEYYGVHFNIKKKSTNEQELEFGIILKDNIPYSLITFELKDFTGYNDVVNVVIDKPKFWSKVSSYVVLYSYDDFFNSQFKGYDTLISLLKNSQIPEKFIDVEITDNFKNKYYHSSGDLGNNINLIVSNPKGFEEEIDKRHKKEIKIYQIYDDSEEQKYIPLENTKTLYVYVFATDMSTNYYIDDENIKTESIVVATQFGPIPLTELQFDQATGELPDLEQSIVFRVKEYSDKSFEHYDLYISEGDAGISEKCGGIANGCYYYNGAGKLTSTSISALITSLDGYISNKYNKSISTSDFTNGLNLENGKKYNLHVIPINSNGKGIYSQIHLSYSLKENNKLEMNSYILDKEFSMENNYYNPISKEIEIMDLKAPDLMSSINIAGINWNSIDNYLYLQWTPLEDNVEKLNVRINTYDTLGLLKEKQNSFIVDISGKLVQLNSGEKIIVDRIVPVQVYENIETFNLDAITSTTGDGMHKSEYTVP